MSPSYHQLDFGPHRLHYGCFGQGPKALVALHGFANHGGYFEELKSLGERYRVFALDLPFHGKTHWEKPQFNPQELLQIIQLMLAKENFKRFSLAGHSMGGRIALGLLPKLWPHLDALILLAPAGLQPTPSDSPILFPLFLRRFLAARLEPPGWILSIFAWARKAKLLNKATYVLFRQQIEQADRRQRLFNCWISLYNFPVHKRKLKKLIQEKELPLYIIYGKEDEITPGRYGQQFAKNLPSAQFHWVADGHFFLRAPLNQCLAQILEEQPYF
ncbi:alpha/beta hydrolase [Saprospira sp. CCB-QB6]|uniref:alpha/beta fold hydrolase n=1 Tax=Saprospira sp. CCB-QB6 TaxID=3023936 RepID=UPI00234A3A3B|nr:alpha/beta hydrolase [Saprospira sp. CCB-QB6]WCL81330.1 alpha/beta hydrolase [Saprospira sp. CCB-QB6]